MIYNSKQQYSRRAPKPFEGHMNSSCDQRPNAHYFLILLIVSLSPAHKEAQMHLLLDCS